jgi:hypothetical protein
MKKSQLRKIIRESIRGLMTEQYNGQTYDPAVFPIIPVPDPKIYHIFRAVNGAGYIGQEVVVAYTGTNTFIPPPCDDGPYYTCHWTMGQAFYNFAQQPQVGEVVKIDNGNGAWQPSPGGGNAYGYHCYEYMGNYPTNPGVNISYTNHHAYIGTFPSAETCDFHNAPPPPPSPCTSYGCTDPTAMNYNPSILPNCDDGSCIEGNTIFGCMDSTSSNYDPTATIDDGSCITTSNCDQSAWANYSNWLNTFTSLPNFSNTTNPNQPCQLLCQRETQFSAQIPNVGPVQANMLQCKLDEVQSLMQTHNCASSNASAC